MELAQALEKVTYKWIRGQANPGQAGVPQHAIVFCQFSDIASWKMSLTYRLAPSGRTRVLVGKYASGRWGQRKCTRNRSVCAASNTGASLGLGG